MVDVEMGRDRDGNAEKESIECSFQDRKDMVAPTSASEANKRPTIVETVEDVVARCTEQSSGEGSTDNLLLRKPDEDDIEDWASCDEAETGNDRVANSTNETRNAVQGTLRSASGKKTPGKSIFGGKTLLFNIHSGNGQSRNIQRGRKWSVPKKGMPTRSLSPETDSRLERADKRLKRSIHEDNINLGGLLIPNKVSVSAGIAKVRTTREDDSETMEAIKSAQEHVDSDAEMGEDGPTRNQKGKSTENASTVQIFELAVTMFKHELKCPQCNGKGTRVETGTRNIGENSLIVQCAQNGNTIYRGKVINCT